MNRKRYRWRILALIVWMGAVFIAIGLAMARYASDGFTWRLLFDFLIVLLFTVNVFEKWQRVKEARHQLT